ncbi:MAG: NAD(P)/FAD-dependent oxidoreductase [Candidatus Bathyarchaeota archaeon]|nr:NAD(P)/FAD-dependent oxidoreductase [Candidatus Bathyarchaeota archaeon]
MKKFDVVVVGAGTGGCLAAKTVAEAGFNVCLIDRKREQDIGDKVCGDAIGKHHFDTLGLEYPAGKELERKLIGVKIYSPDMKFAIDVKGEGLHGYMVNRRLFGQRVLKEATKAGATFLERTQAVELIVKDHFVNGVLARNMETGNKVSVFGQVTVDASGFSAVLQKKLPPEIGVDANASREDVVICYREIREVKEQIAEPDFCEIYLNQKVSPGGYFWIFPEGGTKVNVGLGVAMSKGFPNPKNRLYDNVLSRPFFRGSSILSGGGGHVPTRRPINCMVGNGILIVGDAACQVNPIHGGGMGPSMMAGTIAGETIIEALETGNVGRENMWSYNVRYMQSYGAKQAGLDVFRLLLQQLNDEDMNYGMKYRLITEDDLLKTSMGEDTRLNITEKTRRIFRGIGKISLLKRLRATVRLMKKMKTLYQTYPVSPEGFDEWKKKTQHLIEEAGKL